MSFLAIDVGNTRLKWAQYATPAPGAELLAHGAVFLETIDHLAETEWARLAPPSSMLGCVVAGDAIKRRVEDGSARPAPRAEAITSAESA